MSRLAIKNVAHSLGDNTLKAFHTESDWSQDYIQTQAVIVGTLATTEVVSSAFLAIFTCSEGCLHSAVTTCTHVGTVLADWSVF